MNRNSYQTFKETVLHYYADHGREGLPWREDPSPYKVTVSEIMLQQTQVVRVVDFFTTWLEVFPDWKSLALAPQKKVLKYWKGLGYNSRALRLHKLAAIVVEKHGGLLPQNYEVLLGLPGIGPYTAGAIMAFAFNTYVPIIETNIRRVYIHHFFNPDEEVSDNDIMNVIQEVGEPESARIWYSALMDYGATLPKRTKRNANQQSKHYHKQSQFEGSDRQIRGKILEYLLKEGKISHTTLITKLACTKKRYNKIAQSLENEGFVSCTKKYLSLV